MVLFVRKCVEIVMVWYNVIKLMVCVWMDVNLGLKGICVKYVSILCCLKILIKNWNKN